jgi:hypothetical protein
MFLHRSARRLRVAHPDRLDRERQPLGGARHAFGQPLDDAADRREDAANDRDRELVVRRPAIAMRIATSRSSSARGL